MYFALGLYEGDRCKICILAIAPLPQRNKT
jgi:hypothetical protein